MPVYKRLLPGYPYIKQPHFTNGFEQGVGYFKNFCKHQPVWVACTVIVAVGFAGLGARYYEEKTTDPDILNMYKNKYTVMRKEDVEDPTKKCYN